MDVLSFYVVDDQGQLSSVLGYVPGFGHEVAVSPVCKEDGRYNVVEIPREIVGPWARSVAAIRVRSIEVNSPELKAGHQRNRDLLD